MRIVLATLAAAALGLSCCQQLSGAAPRFAAAVEPVRWDDLRHSFRAGCPVPPTQLRTVRVSHWDFAGRTQEGRIVVARAEAAKIVQVFRTLWQERFPIRRLQPVSAYRGSDDASMAADNTSSFNCRRAVGSATGSSSSHS